MEVNLYAADGSCLDMSAEEILGRVRAEKAALFDQLTRLRAERDELFAAIEDVASNCDCRSVPAGYDLSTGGCPRCKRLVHLVAKGRGA